MWLSTLFSLHHLMSRPFYVWSFPPCHTLLPTFWVIFIRWKSDDIATYLKLFNGILLHSGLHVNALIWLTSLCVIWFLLTLSISPPKHLGGISSSSSNTSGFLLPSYFFTNCLFFLEHICLSLGLVKFYSTFRRQIRSCFLWESCLVPSQPLYFLLSTAFYGCLFFLSLISVCSAKTGAVLVACI